MRAIYQRGNHLPSLRIGILSPCLANAFDRSVDSRKRIKKTERKKKRDESLIQQKSSRAEPRLTQRSTTYRSFQGTNQEDEKGWWVDYVSSRLRFPPPFPFIPVIPFILPFSQSRQWKHPRKPEQWFSIWHQFESPHWMERREKTVSETLYLSDPFCICVALPNQLHQAKS
jgi:hypothetical protein